MPNTPDIAVIGGGIGGLSAAIHLAAAGANVRVYEQNSRVGGKMNLWQSGGFTFDTGPHVLTMLFALEDLFQTAGTSLAAELDVTRLDTICRYHFAGGETIDAPGDINAAHALFNAGFAGDAQGFRDFLALSERIYNQATPTFLCQDFADHIEPLKLPEQMRHFLELKPFETLDHCVQRHFRDPRLRQIFNLYALYSGSDPARCSKLLSVIAHVQWGLGTYYVRGGLYTVAEKLRAVAERMGAVITTDARVTEIITDGNRAKGVAVDVHGRRTREFADSVICNRDALTAQQLLNHSMRQEPTCQPTPSAFLLLLGIDGMCPNLAHHNSFLTSDEAGEYASLWDDAGIPNADPTLGVACPTVTDPTRAPKGCATLFVMANVPALNANTVWTPEFTVVYRKRVLQKLERMGVVDLAKRIRVEQIWTPETFATRYGAWRGALYGPPGNGVRHMFTRPPNSRAVLCWRQRTSRRRCAAMRAVGEDRGFKGFG